MRIAKIIIAVALAALTLMCACRNESAEIVSISLEKSIVEITEGSAACPIKATDENGKEVNISSDKLQFEVEDEEIADIDANGLITGNKRGITKYTVSYQSLEVNGYIAVNMGEGRTVDNEKDFRAAVFNAGRGQTVNVIGEIKFEQGISLDEKTIEIKGYYGAKLNFSESKVAGNSRLNAFLCVDGGVVGSGKENCDVAFSDIEIVAPSNMLDVSEQYFIAVFAAKRVVFNNCTINANPSFEQHTVTIFDTTEIEFNGVKFTQGHNTSAAIALRNGVNCKVNGADFSGCRIAFSIASNNGKANNLTIGGEIKALRQSADPSALFIYYEQPSVITIEENCSIKNDLYITEDSYFYV